MTTKRTFQPNSRRHSKTYNLRLHTSTRISRATLAARRRKGRAELPAWDTPAPPCAHHMVDPADFTAAIRQGTRAGDPLVIVHTQADEEHNSHLVDFVVPKRETKRASGRNRVKQQLRHLMHERIADLSKGTRVVVKASSKVLGVPFRGLDEHPDRIMARARCKWNARRT